MEGATAGLVRQALMAARVAARTDDWDEYWTLLRRAASDGSGSLDLGLELIGSVDPVERATGCDLLGSASDQNESVRVETASALIGLAKREQESCVLWSLAGAILGTDDPRTVPVLVELAGHPDAEVRRQVACSFAGLTTTPPDGQGIRALVALTRDADPEVRNWATFTLGSQLEIDGPAIRAALWERTTDEYSAAREEGIHGLARRHDPRAVPLLVELLEDPAGAHVLTFAAAQNMGAPELLPALLAYEPDGTGVTAAVRSCDPLERTRVDAAAWDLVCALHRLRPDLDASASMARFDSALSLDLDAAWGSPGYDVVHLLERADGDPLRAAASVAADLPPHPGASADAAALGDLGRWCARLTRGRTATETPEWSPVEEGAAVRNRPESS